MFELVLMFLATFVVSVAAVWLYRKLSSREGVAEKLARGTQATNQKKMGLQKGYISAFSKPKQKARNVRLRSTGSDIKVPWGW